MPVCAVCPAEVADRRLCGEHLDELRRDLADLAGRLPGGAKHEPMVPLPGELDTAMARLSRMTHPAGGGRPAERPLPVDLRAGRAAERLWSSLVVAVDMLARHRGLEHPEAGSSAVLAGWLYNHLDDIGQADNADDLHRTITAAARRARDAIDRPPDRVFVGPCPRCAADLSVAANHDTVTCGCGWSCAIEERRAYLRDAAADQLRTAAELSDALVQIAGRRIPRNTISKWGERGKITRYPPHARDGRRETRYRVGEVLTMARVEERRAAEERERQAG